MRNSSPPDSPGSRADAAFPRSPMLRRIEADQTNRSMRRIGKIATAVAAAAAVTVGTIYSDVLKSYFGFEKGGSASSGSGEFLSGPCPPGDLACLDERYYEDHGFPFSHGEPDGCVLLTPKEQLESPLCCSGVAADPSVCPPLDEVPPDASGDPQDSELLPGGVNEPTKKNEEPAPSSPPSPAIPPRKIDDPFGDSDVELPG